MKPPQHCGFGTDDTRLWTLLHSQSHFFVLTPTATTLPFSIALILHLSSRLLTYAGNPRNGNIFGFYISWCW
jgi:hypothetical protein